MIRLRGSILREIMNADLAGLRDFLQNAVELEHSTIPPYLTAMFSLMPGVNDEIGRLIRSIVIQEMLHMTIDGNILIAIGGRPQINMRKFIPTYPGPLPMSIGGSGFIVGIEAFSKPLVENVFMVIEAPEEPIPIETLLAAEAEPEYATIGQFYDAIKKRISALGNSIFTVSKEQQVLQWFPPDHLFPIVDVVSAVRAIDIIVREGEGTSTEPFQGPGTDPAHYYKFEEIFYGRKIIPKPGGGYVYGGAPIPFDSAGVYPMKANPKIADFEPGTRARARIEEFSYAYSSLLNALHTAFNGAADNINVAIGLMYELKMLAVSLMQTPLDDGSGLTAGPSFEYIDRLPV